MTQGQKIYDFIEENTAAGMTIYASTCTNHTKITRNTFDRGLVRLSGSHCEIARGKAWDSINYCRITARYE